MAKRNKFGKKVNSLFAPNGHLETRYNDMNFRYECQIDTSGCGLASAIAEIRCIGMRLRIAADIFDPSEGDCYETYEAHDEIACKLADRDIANRIEKACSILAGNITAIPAKDGGIDFKFDYTCELYEQRRDIIAVWIRELAHAFGCAADRLYE